MLLCFTDFDKTFVENETLEEESKGPILPKSDPLNLRQRSVTNYKLKNPTHPVGFKSNNSKILERFASPVLSKASPKMTKSMT